MIYKSNFKLNTIFHYDIIEPDIRHLLAGSGRDSPILISKKGDDIIA